MVGPVRILYPTLLQGVFNVWLDRIRKLNLDTVGRGLRRHLAQHIFPSPPRLIEEILNDALTLVIINLPEILGQTSYSSGFRQRHLAEQEIRKTIVHELN